jgi:hypothetical protein
MDKLKALLTLLGRKNSSNDDTPEGYCPNCWGREEYGGRFYDAVKNNGVDINSNDASIGWVQEYADKHLNGIELHPDGENFVCKKCKLTYRPE